MSIGKCFWKKYKYLSLLFIGQIFAGIGSGIFDIALIWYALEEAEDISVVGLVLFLRFIPYAFFGLFGGWVGDRWDRRMAVILADAFRSLVMFIAALTVAMQFSVISILALSALLLTISRTIFQPAIQGMIPALCEPDDLPRVNAIHHGIREFLGIASPLLGSLLLIAVPAHWVLVCVSILFLLGSALTAFLPRSTSVPARGGSFFSDYRELINYLNVEKKEILHALLLNASAILGAAGVLSLLLPAHIKSMFPENPEHLGILMGFMAAGTLLGAVVVGWANARASLANMYLGWVIYGTIILAFALPLNYVFLLMVSALLGAVGAVPDILFATAVQERVSEDRLSKTFALFSTLANLGEALSAPLLALIVATKSIEAAFLIGGVLAVISAIAGLTALRYGRR